MDLEADAVIKSANELQKQIDDIFNGTDSNTVSKEFQNIQISAARASNSVKQILNDVSAMQTTPAPEFKEVADEGERLQEELTKAKQKLDELLISAKKFVMSQGGLDAQIHTDSWDATLHKIHVLKEEQAEFVAQIESAPEEVKELAQEYQELVSFYNELDKESEPYRTGALAGDESARSKYVEYEKIFNEIDEELAVMRDLMDEVFNNADSDLTAQEFLSAKEKVEEYNTSLKEARQFLKFLRADNREFTTVRESDPYKDRVEEIQKAKDEVAKLTEAEAANTEQQEKMKAAGVDSVAGVSEKYDELIDKLQLAVNALSLQIRKLEEAKEKADNIDDKNMSPLSNINGWQTLINVINQGPKAIVNVADTIVKTLPPAFQVLYAVAKKVIGFIWNEFKSVVTKLANIVKNVFTKAVNAANTALKSLLKTLLRFTASTILSPFKKLADTISNIGKQAQSSTPSLKQLGRMFLQYGIGARSLYRFINKLRTALFEGFGTLAVAYEPFNAAMSRIVTSLEYLKNSFAAAFAPIIQYVAPALSIFIDKMASAVQMIGQFIAALTGQEFVMALPVYKDYADNSKAGAAANKELANSEKQAKKMAEDEAKAQKKREKALKDVQRTIAGFDDVEILKENTNDSDDSDTSIDPSDYNFDTPTLEKAMQTFTTMPIKAAALEFSEWLKKMWKDANFYDLGKLLSQKLGDILRTFNRNVPQIQAFLEKLAKSLATFVAGFLSVNDTFKVLGVAIGNVINLFFHTIRTALDEFIKYDGFVNLGKDIYYTIVNALAKINWDDIYAVFRDLGYGMAQTLNEVITKPDFWIGIFDALCNALRAVLIRIIAFSTTLQWGEIGSSMAQGVIHAIENFPYEEASQAIRSFLGGLWTMFYNFVIGMEGHWVEIGTNAANFIIGLFEDFNPDEFGTGVASFLNGLCDAFLAFVNTPGWGEIVDKIAESIKTFAIKFEWGKHADGLLEFLNHAVSKLTELVDGLNLSELFDKIYNYLKDNEDFQNLINNIVDLVITLTGTAIKLKFMGFSLLGGSILNYIGNGIKDNIQGNAEDSTQREMDALGIEWDKHSGDLNNMGAGAGDEITSGFDSTIAGTASSAENAANNTVSIWDNMPWNKSGSNAGSELNSGLSSQARPINSTATNIQQDTLKTLGSGNYKLIGSTNLGNYNTGVSSFRSNIQGSIRTISTDVQSGLGEGDYNGIGSGISKEYDRGIDSNGDLAKGTAQSIADGIAVALDSVDGSSIGSNILNGIYNGLMQGWRWLCDTVWNLATDLFNSACNALGIASPSKVFADKVGAMIPAGIGIGITANEDLATDTIDDMANSLVKRAGNIKIPPIAMGNVIPYNTNIQEDTNTTMKTLLDVIQSLEDSTVKRDELEEILTNVIRSNMNISFYIGDEKLARHANRGNSLIDRRYNAVSTT